MAEVKKQETKGEEKEYVIPLRGKWIKEARYKKTNKAVKAVKEFLARHMKVRDRDLNKIKLDTYLNNFLWMRGIRNPPVRVRVKAFREGDKIRVELLDFPDKLKFRKTRLEKRETKAAEILEKKKEEKPAEESKEEKTEEKKEDSGEKTEESEKDKEEKKSAVVETGKEQAKKQAKMAKHQTKTSKQPKQQQRKALKK